MRDEAEDYDGIVSDDEVILLKPPPRSLCKCWNCSFYAHTAPPRHFGEEDIGFCCSWCRLSKGKKHGNHCQRKRKKKEKRKKRQ